MRLAGDVGGTKTVLAELDARGAVVREQTFASREHATFDELVAAFAGDRAVEAAAFGVAGPIAGGVARLTNLPWVIDARALAPRLGRVALLNDLQATALGMLDVPPSGWHVLQPGVASDDAAHAPIAVVAPGTGFGQAILVPNDGRYRALATEAGHADFAPTTDDEIALLRFLRAKHGDHVSYERVLCGLGLGDVYAFCREASGVAPPGWLVDEMAAGDPNAAIARAALAGRDAACERTLAMFVALLGAEAGNAALRVLARAGVWLGGGIPPKLLPALVDGGFLARFHAKGRFGDWMKTVPVRVCLEPRAALLGAARAAREA